VIYIITSRYQLALNKCREIEVSPHDSDVRIFTRPEMLQGVVYDDAHDEYYFLAVPEDWATRLPQALQQAWQHILESSRAMN
jgi:hypothetical protein